MVLGITRDTILASVGLLPYSESFFFEAIDMVIMALAIGYIFSDYIRKPVSHDYDPLTSNRSGLWDRVKWAAIAAGPAVVLHELAHKFVAMGFGAKAVLYAPYGFYLLVVVLKAIGFPFLFFVGGFVRHSPLPAFQSSLVSVAGPLMNFLLYFGAIIVIRKNMVDRKYLPVLVMFAKINLFLGIFNMIPLPGFDGFNFFAALFSAFFGS